MGRKPWATPEQTAFLKTQLPFMDEEKEMHGLTPFYARVTIAFIEQWASPIVPIPPKPQYEGLEPKAYADLRRGKQITEWFKKHRKHSNTSSQPKSIFDLTGKRARKPPPLQTYQAYSIRYYRPNDSPLRLEVKGLWLRRKEQEVIDKVSSFMIKEEDFDSRMLFHNAVMRWKCSLLSEEEKIELQKWIDDDIAKKWADIQQPWKSLQTDDIDEPTAENQYVQSLINALPSTMQAALEEVERVTGMKAILLMGGPIPAQDGGIGTHLYATGQSRISGLTFSKSWDGFEIFYSAFIEWLRTTYSEQERSQRRGYSTYVTDDIPPRPHVSDATAVPDVAIDTVVPARDSSPTSSTSSESSHGPVHPLPNNVLQRSPSVTIAEDDQQLPPSPTLITGDSSQLVFDSVTRNVSQPPPPLVEVEAGSQPRRPPPIAVADDVPRPPIPVAITRGVPRPSPTTVVVTSQQPPDNAPAEPIHNNRTPITSDIEGSATNSLPLGVFTLNSPSSFITSSTINYWETVPGGQRWIDTVKAYLRLEELPMPPGCPLRLPATLRPAEVSMWMKARLYTADRIPHVSDTEAYCKQWIEWWKACQPPWRKTQGWPFSREGHDKAEWGKLAARSKNGLFMVIMSTTWWAASLKPADNRRSFDEAVDDVRWVIERMLESRSGSGTTGAIQDPSRPQGPQVPSSPGNQVPAGLTATWMARKGGKRQPKPSRALLEKMAQ